MNKRAIRSLAKGYVNRYLHKQSKKPIIEEKYFKTLMYEAILLIREDGEENHKFPLNPERSKRLLERLHLKALTYRYEIEIVGVKL